MLKGFRDEHRFPLKKKNYCTTEKIAGTGKNSQKLLRTIGPLFINGKIFAR